MWCGREALEVVSDGRVGWHEQDSIGFNVTTALERRSSFRKCRIRRVVARVVGLCVASINVIDGAVIGGRSHGVPAR